MILKTPGTAATRTKTATISTPASSSARSPASPRMSARARRLVGVRVRLGRRPCWYASGFGAVFGRRRRWRTRDPGPLGDGMRPGDGMRRRPVLRRLRWRRSARVLITRGRYANAYPTTRRRASAGRHERRRCRDRGLRDGRNATRMATARTIATDRWIQGSCSKISLFRHDRRPRLPHHGGLYWGVTSLLGAQEDRRGAIDDEWEPCTPALMRSTRRLSPP